MTKVKPYHYTECGLDNIFVSGLVVSDDEGNNCLHIPNVQQLHDLIAVILLTNTSQCLSGKELYFIRSEIGLNTALLAEQSQISIDKLKRWEEQSEIDNKTDINFKKFCLNYFYQKVSQPWL